MDSTTQQGGALSSIQNSISSLVAGGIGYALAAPSVAPWWFGQPLYEAHTEDKDYKKAANQPCCQLCSLPFGYVSPRPHHCRYCNQCICWLCSIYLLEGKRACHDCYVTYRLTRPREPENELHDIKVTTLAGYGDVLGQLLEKCPNQPLQFIYFMGVWYRDGCFDLPVNTQRALDLFHVAAVSKHADANYQLGVVCLEHPDWILANPHFTNVTAEDLPDKSVAYMFQAAQLGSFKGEFAVVDVLLNTGKKSQDVFDILAAATQDIDKTLKSSDDLCECVNSFVRQDALIDLEQIKERLEKLKNDYKSTNKGAKAAKHQWDEWRKRAHKLITMCDDGREMKKSFVATADNHIRCALPILEDTAQPVESWALSKSQIKEAINCATAVSFVPEFVQSKLQPLLCHMKSNHARYSRSLTESMLATESRRVELSMSLNASILIAAEKTKEWEKSQSEAEELK